MDVMSIRIMAPPDPQLAFKVQIKLCDLNVADPDGRSGQGYFVVSGQSEEERCQWVHGVVHQLEPHCEVRQFVALAPGTGHSFQDQLCTIHDGAEFDIEVTPNIEPEPEPALSAISLIETNDLKETFFIYVKNLQGATRGFKVHSTTTLSALQAWIHSHEGIPENSQRLICAGNQLLVTREDATLGYHKIGPGAIVHLVGRVCGGRETEQGKLEVGPGGLIRQSLHPDHGDHIWATTPMVKFKIRITDPENFERLTGQPPPPRPSTPEGGEPKAVGWNDRVNGLAEVRSIAESQRHRNSPVSFTPVELEAGGGPSDPIERRPSNNMEHVTATKTRTRLRLRSSSRETKKKSASGYRRIIKEWVMGIKNSLGGQLPFRQPRR
ncbi:hypothetical protein ACHAPT_002359 [Fusarium lateritium]